MHQLALPFVASRNPGMGFCEIRPGTARDPGSSVQRESRACGGIMDMAVTINSGYISSVSLE